MRAIVIEEAVWKKRRRELLEQIELINLRHRGEEVTVGELHRKMHYHVCVWLDDMERS